MDPILFIGFGIVCFLLGGFVSTAIEAKNAKQGKVTVLGGEVYRYVKVVEETNDTPA